MSITVTSEIDAFQSFLGQQRAQGIEFVTPEESVGAFRSYQREIKELRNLLAPALEESARGETFVLDEVAFKSELVRGLAEKGIPE